MAPSTSGTSEGDLDGFSNSPTKAAHEPSTLSPIPFEFSPNNQADALPSIVTTTVHTLDNDNLSIYSPMSVESNGSTNSYAQKRSSNTLMVEDANGVFNFQPSVMTKAPVSAKSNIGQRRGHKYKHSSVSHQLFLEPEPKPALSLPNSLPVPTFSECRRSMSRSQINRVYWSLCHMAVAAYTLGSAEGSLALTALSHLILFDSLGAMVCVAVDILGNFEVWKRSSIRHPFGLERAEVLAGFAMSVLLLFMGFDLISHNLQHFLEAAQTDINLEAASSSHHHRHHTTMDNAGDPMPLGAATGNFPRVSAGEVDSAALLAIVATLISALGLKNHARIGRAMRFAYMDSLPVPSVLANPSHFLTLSCSLIMLILPLLSIETYQWLDRLLSATMALSMCILGTRLVRTLGFMLLMSFGGNSDNLDGVAEVLHDIEADPSVSTVEDARFWQVHYGLCIAVLKLRVVGSEDGLNRLRERVQGWIKSRLGGGYGSTSGCRWEITVQMNVEKFR